MEGYYSIKGFLIPSSTISRHKRNHNNKSRMHRHREVVSFRNQESADGYYSNLEKRKAFSRMRRTAAAQPSDNVTQDFYSLGEYQSGGAQWDEIKENETSIFCAETIEFDALTYFAMLHYIFSPSNRR